MSMYILTAVPPITAMLMYFVNRDYILALFQTPMGHKMLTTAVLLGLMLAFVIGQGLFLAKYVEPKESE